MNNLQSTGAGAADEFPLHKPEFKRLLARRSRLRWRLSGVLIAAYMGWALAGLYAPDALGASFMGSLVTWGIVIGYLIIAASIVCSIVYIQIIDRIYLSLDRGKREHS